MTNFILAAVLMIILGGAVIYIIKEKKKGAVCIGCSHTGCCAGRKKSGSDCGCQ
ncbi:MAG: FeoB-associated Cys-rich membrane protein [Lachnospiraceae bacterium]|nr:FeoB-associated Cys-rich membrane protein [Lachnospiraceae bacterium]